MCNPVAMVAMAVVQGAMQMQQANAQAAAVEQEGRNANTIAQFNAGQNELAADDAVRRGSVEASDKREIARKLNATGSTRMAGAGLVDNTGTNVDMLAQNAQMGEYNALTVMNNAEREAYGFRAEAKGQRLGGQVALNNSKFQADTMKYNGKLGAAGTIVSGFSDFGVSKGWFGGSSKTVSKQTPFGMRSFTTA